MKVRQGGTQLWCPNCSAVHVCREVSPTAVGEPSAPRRYYEGSPEIQFFRRGRACLTCNAVFTTAEVKESFLVELIRLRDYLTASKTHDETVARITSSLGALKTPTVYHGVDAPDDSDLCVFGLSDATRSTLRSHRITTVKELCGYSARELLKLWGVDDEVLAEVQTYLRKEGLCLRPR